LTRHIRSAVADKISKKATKARFPQVAIMTTARDLSFGLDTGGDISVPHMDIYVNNLDAIAKARKQGKQVW
jgi:hypothetical protein